MARRMHRVRAGQKQRVEEHSESLVQLPQPRVHVEHVRRADNRDPSRPQDAVDLTRKAELILHMLHDFETARDVERSVIVRQPSVVWDLLAVDRRVASGAIPKRRETSSPIIIEKYPSPAPISTTRLSGRSRPPTRENTLPFVLGCEIGRMVVGVATEADTRLPCLLVARRQRGSFATARAAREGHRPNPLVTSVVMCRFADAHSVVRYRDSQTR